MTARPRVGLLGGTFDPIHNGHLAVAEAGVRALSLDAVRFIPSARPPHRPDSPIASEYHRLEMARRAVATNAAWEVSDLELQRNGPSYTFDTLAQLHREGLTPLQIFFLTGADAFAEIATWHQYPAVLDSAHFAVVARPGAAVGQLHQRLPSLASRMVRADEIDAARTPRIVLIEWPTPDVSSTDIRRRVMTGDPIDTFVPAAVAAYIMQHALYREPGR
jgi:nicotinate-nucleotide adenylyltransferase